MSLSPSTASADTATPAGPYVMPKEVVDWERARMWGMHHLRWHMERLWDVYQQQDPSTIDWAQQQGWSRQDVQEGAAGNGLAFLAMHHVMLERLRQSFPADAKLFTGWSTPPVGARDPQGALPGDARQPFSVDMQQAIDRAQGDLSAFASDDDFGLYLETALRPTADHPTAKSSDSSAGLHNYLHNRFSDDKSPINLGDPTVNLENQLFWRLHGWIDARWMAFRAAKGLGDDDPVYQAALAKAEAEVPSAPVRGLPGDGMGDQDTVPDALHHMFENPALQP